MDMPKDCFYPYEKTLPAQANGVGPWLSKKVGSINREMTMATMDKFNGVITEITNHAE